MPVSRQQGNLPYPFPEIVRHGRWTVLPLGHGGAMDPKKRTMLVDLSAPYVTAHELAHVAFTPARPPITVAKASKVSISTLQCVEDARVNLKAEWAGNPVGMHPPEERDAMLFQAWVSETPAYDLLRCAMSWGHRVRGEDFTQAARRLMPAGLPLDGGEAILARVREVSTLALALLTLQPSFRRAIKVSQIIERLVPPPPPQAAAASFEIYPTHPQPVDHGEEEPGEVFVERPRLTASLPGRLARVARPQPEGIVPCYAHRWPTDQAVFAKPRRGQGATILVDASMSMGVIAPATLQRLLALAPGATVVLYGSKPPFQAGVMRVVADRGRMTTEGRMLRSPGSGNVIDLPALTWLARQGEPRIWVSDGMVTGKGDHFSQALYQKAKVVKRRARIAQVVTIQGAMRLLTRLNQ